MEVQSISGLDSVQPLFPAVQFVGESPVIANLKQTAGDIARRRSTVMILGETGCGKEMLARFIHNNSTRVDKPFIPVDCSSLSDTLFESELFGHVKGAFTGATRDSLGFIRAADSGTLFLDEIADLSLHLQAKLLRVLQEKCVVPVGDFRARPVDIRVISATNRPLEAMVREGTFRQDLFFRLNVVVLKLPPLRERKDDILSLAEHFLKVQSDLYGEPVKTLEPQTVSMLQEYSWPGNVRELSNVMEHAHVIAASQQVTVSDLPPRLQSSSGVDSPEDLSLQDIERCTIAKALKKMNFNKAAAARLLGINIQRLNRRIIRLQIRIPEPQR
ncbi:MAG TPA: sigma 54-interacting transcriptional regulator [Tepidisphaeraceae bacterium]|jgi:transcriptional regulator with PAS, ATPase and Fis domain|nr:sigma 54-interacting transcriptional regulator [Tepidisphaeraceae bacterium]